MVFVASPLLALSLRRVVVTGIGVVSPLAANAEDTWSRMVAGESAIISIPDVGLRNRAAAKVGGFIPLDGEYAFIPTRYIEERDLRKMAAFMHYALASVAQAIDDAGLVAGGDGYLQNVDLSRAGVFVGSGIGGLEVLESSILKIQESGKVSPMFIPSILINVASGHVAIKYKLGGEIASHCSACASGLQSIAEAARSVAIGTLDLVVAGGCESSMCESSFAGFHSCRALSTSFNDAPHKASRPWDKSRDGFVMSEGAGIMIIEEYEHAKARGARIYAEIVGTGVGADCYHVTAPDPGGAGACSAMSAALLSAKMGVDDIDYVKAHATSTPTGDEVELLAVSKVFKGRRDVLHMSSMKSSIGHTLGASGGIESALALLAMRDGVLPPTLNLDDPIAADGFDLVPKVAKPHKIRSLMSNAFGFGGVNVSVIFRVL